MTAPSVFLSGKFHRQRDLVGYSAWGHKESGTTTHTICIHTWHCSFLVVSLEFSIYCIMSSPNSDSFTFSFSILIPFISSLISVARNYKTMLNKSGESGHSSLIPDLRGNAFSFSPLSDVSSEFLTYSLYYVAIYSLYAHILGNLYHK